MNIEEFKLEKINYIISFPENFKPNKKYPIILFLHGAGSRGKDMNAVITNPYFTITNSTHKNFPFVTVAPQCCENTWFDLWENLKKLVLEIHKLPFADTEQIYLIGASMGGYATWQLAMSMPEYFAAIVPICGGGMYWNAGRLINTPIWAFHGAKDTTVLCAESEKMVNKVNSLGGNAKLTIYPENAHDAWSDTYKNPDVFNWFLEHKNINAKKLTDNYSNSKIYG